MSEDLYWLMKTEPDTFGFDDLVRRPKKTESWDGVRNYLARNYMRDRFKVGQSVFIYHSRVEEPAIVGIAKVVREAYPDPSALDRNSQYYDEKSAAKGESRWCMVDVKAHARFAEPILLKRLKNDKVLLDMALVKPGQRLSIQQVALHEWNYICGLSKVIKV